MKRHLMRTRLPQPAGHHGRDLAESIWKRRHEIVAVPCEGDNPTSIDIEVTPALKLHINDRTDEQLVTATKTSYGKHGSVYVAGRGTGCHVEDCARPWVAYAWRAAQAARLLAALGLDDDVPEGTPLCVPMDPEPGRLRRLARMVAPRRRPTTVEFLEERLDQEIARRIAAMPLDSPTSHVMEIGGGVSIDAASHEPLLAVSHPEHGTLTLPGRAAHELNARMDAMRLAVHRTLPSGGGRETARIARVLRICHEAIALDPDMTDGAGVPLRPLLDEHLPRLAARHREALIASSPEDRDAIDAEVARALEGIVPSMEQGMATAARLKRDALRTELRFIASRHPDEPTLADAIR